MPIDRIKKQLVRNPGDFRDATIFLVATEGEKTEKIYLSLFHSPRIKLVTLPCDDGHSSPSGVLDKISEARSQHQFGAGDSFWILCDRDQWTEEKFSQVYRACKQQGVSLLVSNERFEVFLCYHFDDFQSSPEYTAAEYEKFLKRKLGSYKKKQIYSRQLPR